MISDEQRRKEAAAALLKDMETIAARMRALIVAMPPNDLLGYIYNQRLLEVMADESAPDKQHKSDGLKDSISDSQFLLEYVHAVLASDAAPPDMTFDEAQCAELFELVRKLREQAVFFGSSRSSVGVVEVGFPWRASAE